MPLLVKLPLNPLLIESIGAYRRALNILDRKQTAVQRQLCRSGLASYEPITQATLLALMERAPAGAAFYDVGAHIGLYSAMIASIFHSTGARVIPFEPAPETADICRSISRRNGLSYGVVQSAVSAQRGEARLYLSEKAETSNSLNQNFRHSTRSVTVPVTTLDDYSSENEVDPWLVKIDVETYEAEVLGGSMKMIERARPWVVLELLPLADHAALTEIFSCLNELGYTLYPLVNPTPWAAHDTSSYRQHLSDTHRDWLLAPEPLTDDFYGTLHRWLTAISECVPETNLLVAKGQPLPAGWNSPYGQAVNPPTDHAGPRESPMTRNLDDVAGWLTETDKMIFEWLLTWQTTKSHAGDLLELGTFQGRTAIHMGRFLGKDESLIVCDLFELAATDKAIRPGARRAYKDLTQSGFERNYLAFHSALPNIVRERTETIADYVEAASCRFIHIDASHTYQDVNKDLLSARKLLDPEGIVAIADYRTEHCPGTAAAVWQAVATEGLRIVCVTTGKFYGTWGNATALQDDLILELERQAGYRGDLQSVMEQRLIRVVRTG